MRLVVPGIPILVVTIDLEVRNQELVDFALILDFLVSFHDVDDKLWGGRPDSKEDFSTLHSEHLLRRWILDAEEVFVFVVSVVDDLDVVEDLAQLRVLLGLPQKVVIGRLHVYRATLFCENCLPLVPTFLGVWIRLLEVKLEVLEEPGLSTTDILHVQVVDFGTF